MKHLFKLGIFMLCFGTFLPFTHAQPDSTRQLIGFAHDNTPIHDLQFSKDGKYLMAISSSVVIWDIAKREKVFTHTMPNMAQNACLAKDANLLAIKHNDREIIIMEANNRTILQTIRLINSEHAFVKIVAFAYQNQSLIVQQDRFHYIYELKTGLFQRKYEINTEKPYFISLHEKFAFAIDTANYQMQLFDYQTNTSLAYFKYGKGEVFKNLFFDVGTMNQVIITHTGNKIRFWETFTYQRIPTKFIPEYELNEKEHFWGLTRDWRYFLYGDDTLKMRYLNNDHVLSPVLVMGTKITACATDSAGKYLVAGDAFGNIKIQDYSDEMLSELYYKTEIETELLLIRSRYGEYVSPEKRKKRHLRAVRNKYLGRYWDKMVNEKLPIELFLESK